MGTKIIQVARVGKFATAMVLLVAAALLAGLLVLFVATGSADAEEDSQRQPSIIDGALVPAGQYRYIAALLDKRNGSGAFQQQMCGGTLIDRNSVLTAAHCVDNSKPGNFRVLLGRTDLTSNGGVARAVTRIFRHPNYRSPVRFAHDVAVLKLGSPAPRSIPVVKLAPVGSGDKWEKPGTWARVSGWGATSDSRTFPVSMRTALVPISRDAYGKSWYGSLFVSQDMIAAGHLGKGTCIGDSGGPLVKEPMLNGKRIPLQIGITSFVHGNGCTTRNAPEGFTEVNSKHIAPFIQSAARK